MIELRWVVGVTPNEPKKLQYRRLDIIRFIWSDWIDVPTIYGEPM